VLIQPQVGVHIQQVLQPQPPQPPQPLQPQPPHAVLKAQINKTDRNDARGIAQMMRVGLYKRSTTNLQLSTRTPADYPIFWHKADMGSSGLFPCKMTPEPHFANRNSLL